MIRKHTCRMVASMLAAAFGMAICVGCGKPASRASTETGALTAGKVPARGDAQVLAEVRRVFSADEDLSKEDIKVSVTNGRVILEGEVSSGAAKIRAEDAARAVPEAFGVDAERLLVG